ncbi:MAG TPA: 16S rRNA (cytidine(1402)-2'-O)-methyltransferase [Polyangiaceae bacterium]
MPAQTLYVVATPIGNLGDLSARAVETLALVERIFAEDTRRTRALLAAAKIEGKPVLRVDAHAEPERVARLLDHVPAGSSAAIVTDAGVPGVSDPGAALVRAAAERGMRVVAIPGASALTAAIAVSGLVEGPFSFHAFLPRQGKKRRLALERIRDSPEPIVLFESPQRIAETLRDLAELAPARRAAVCRELTKLYEETLRGTLAELAALEREWLGEITLVLGPGAAHAAPEQAPSPEELDAEIARRIEKGEHPKALSAEIAARLGIPKRAAYARVLAVREQLE